MSEPLEFKVPKKRGRPRKFANAQEKAKADADRKRAKRQAAATSRCNEPHAGLYVEEELEALEELATVYIVNTHTQGQIVRPSFGGVIASSSAECT
ncbi:hypothetical protein MGU_08841 [Metarhizium guizhouense ARSEF 977]|uniref:Uncharacterized protein n=1 Tax=Metarhizium guizhouense (strain ARSEF 977) TaxID=1276136 RepID=A0A0B4HP72_METGA|nr:hypothetical protein MGU_11400 [Metarhizium guizhouense ARSEF 977]KID83869.1 hypothetical protein MGU_08841 [Metarhizium guizhouense ARSEF 977]